MIEVYAVRQKSTGLFIPRLKTGRRRGGSHLEPTDKREPRIFHNKQAAKAFLGNWLRGVAITRTSDYDGDVFTEVLRRPHRKREDMEIVRLECREVAQCP